MAKQKRKDAGVTEKKSKKLKTSAREMPPAPAAPAATDEVQVGACGRHGGLAWLGPWREGWGSCCRCQDGAVPCGRAQGLRSAARGPASGPSPSLGTPGRPFFGHQACGGGSWAFGPRPEGGPSPWRCVGRGDVWAVAGGLFLGVHPTVWVSGVAGRCVRVHLSTWV